MQADLGLKGKPMMNFSELYKSVHSFYHYGVQMIVGFTFSLTLVLLLRIFGLGNFFFFSACGIFAGISLAYTARGFRLKSRTYRRLLGLCSISASVAFAIVVLI